MENSTQNIRGYTGIFYSVSSVAASLTSHSTTQTPTLSSPTSSRGSSRECRRVVQLATRITSIARVGRKDGGVSGESESVSPSWNASFIACSIISLLLAGVDDGRHVCVCVVSCGSRCLRVAPRQDWQVELNSTDMSACHLVVSFSSASSSVTSSCSSRRPPCFILSLSTTCMFVVTQLAVLQ